MRTIGLLAFFLALCLLPAACGDDNSVTDDHDDGASVTCEKLCTFSSSCYPETGYDSYPVDECLDGCDDDSIGEYKSTECYLKCELSCNCYFDCMDSNTV